MCVCVKVYVSGSVCVLMCMCPLLLLQQRRELCEVTAPEAPPTELQLANRWAAYWRPYLLEALMSDVPLVQTNSSTYLLPCTLRTYPSAVEPLLAHLNPTSPQELHAWAC